MEITLNFTKSIHENAAVYYEKAKKAKKKLEGAKKALEISKQKLTEVLKEQVRETKVQPVAVKREWYEKFHWFFSSEGFLIIGGRDAITNEIVIKKHTEQNDIVFHTDMQGSPFFVVKTNGKQPGERTMAEAATATAVYSKAWKLGFVNTNAGWMTPQQISKSAKAGEYLTKGAFIINGKVNNVEHDFCFAIGVKEHKIIAGPYNAIKEHAEKFVEIVQGDEKPSDIAKTLKALFKTTSTDEIIRMLPSGNCKIRKN
jgi:predicted ribosome quality control (RQC) complex YloA/Tae2 family protein